MANENNLANPAGALQGQGLMQNQMVRQLLVMVGIAASVALGVAVVLWSQTPTYNVLYGNLGAQQTADVVAALQQANVDFKIDETTGTVMVPAGKVREVQMNLAGQGLPQSDSLGFELLQQETGFGTSRALEAARFHRVLETELARTISTLGPVQTARVHLAMPKQSVFVRNRKRNSASVVLSLFQGRSLEKNQINAIVHLVASSVPELETGSVTVVDQKGRLLSSTAADDEIALTSTQFEYTRQLEEHYQQRVEEILAPIIGPERVRAQVTADIDFTITEQTAERFNPDLPALRSEQINEQSSSVTAVQGVPGALTNQPPAAGTAPEEAVGTGEEGQPPVSPTNNSRQATRNFELDKTVSHTRLSTGSLRQLSVAVVIDDRTAQDASGNVTRIERTPEEINRITLLVQDAIGFNATRGDNVRVINAPFLAPEVPEALPEPAIWEQPWVWDLAKQVGGVILVLLLIFFVLRPAMKRLTAPPVVQRIEGSGGAPGEEGQQLAGGGQGMGQIGAPGEPGMQLPGPEKYEDTLEAARKMVDDDPKRVAQVVKSWVTENG